MNLTLDRYEGLERDHAPIEPHFMSRCKGLFIHIDNPDPPLSTRSEFVTRITSMQNKILDEQKSIAERKIFIRKVRKKTRFRNKSESQVVDPLFLKVDKSHISNYLDISNPFNDASND